MYNWKFYQRCRRLEDEARWARARADYYIRTGVDIDKLPPDEAAVAIKDIYQTPELYAPEKEIRQAEYERAYKPRVKK